MAKPNNNNIFMRAVGVAVLGAASLSATEWQYTAPSLFEATSSFQSAGLELWGGQSAVSLSAASTSNSGWGAAASIGPTASAWGVESSTVYSDDVFRSYLYSGSTTDVTSGNGSFSSAWSTYNSNTSSASAWGGSSSSSAWASSSSSWGASYDPWGSNSSSGGAWYTAAGNGYSGAWGGAWGGSSSGWGSSSGSTADYAACSAVSSWAATSSSASSGGAPVWGGSYAAPAVTSAPVSTCASTISNLAPVSNLESSGSEPLAATPELEVFDSPEPSTWMMLLSGAALAAFARRKRAA